jgi:hypothetical protein
LFYSWIANNWSVARKEFLESLGHRTQGWTKNQPNQNNTSSNWSVGNSLYHNPSTPYSASTDEPPLLLLSGGLVGGGNSSTYLKNRKKKIGLSKLLDLHSEVVLGLNEDKGILNLTSTNTNTNKKISTRPILKFMDICASSESFSTGELQADGLDNDDISCYYSILNMLSEMVNENSKNSFPAGYFSPLCFNPEYENIQIMNMNINEYDSKLRTEQNDLHQILSNGAIKHFTIQKWKQLEETVEELKQCGKLYLPQSQIDNNGGNSKHSKIRAYVRHLYETDTLYTEDSIFLSSSSSSSSAPPLSPIDGCPIWAVVYYCLRVGDFTGAKNELARCISNKTIVQKTKYYEAAYNALEFYEMFNDEKISLDNEEFGNAIFYCEECYLESKAEVDKMLQYGYIQDIGIDPYGIFVLNLFGLDNTDDLTEPDISMWSIEDLLWSNLWFIKWNRFIKNQGSELEFYNTILGFGGSDFFDSERLYSFNYSLILFACHRFGDAIAYLWESRKTLPAISLAMICLHYGLILPHVSLSNNPKLINQYPNPSNFGSELSPSTIFQAYFHTSFQRNYPDIALDYFISLFHKNWVFYCKNMLSPSNLEPQIRKANINSNDILKSLIINCGEEQLKSLLGESIADNSRDTTTRTEGHLDKYMSNEDINRFLSKIAESSVHDIENQMILYKLAGEYGEVLRLLNEEYSKVIITDIGHFSYGRGERKRELDRKDYWSKKSIEFYEQYIKFRYGEVYYQNSGNNDMYNLIEIFKILLNINMLIDSCRTNDDNINIIGLLDNISYLPTNHGDDILRKATIFLQIECFRPIKRVTDDVIIISLKTMKKRYNLIKNKLIYNTTPEVKQEMDILKSRALILKLFVLETKSQLIRPDTPKLVLEIVSEFC